MKLVLLALSLLAALSSQADVVDPGAGAFTIKCVSAKSKKGYNVEVAPDLTKAKVNTVTSSTTTFAADLTCSKIEPSESAQSAKGAKTPIARCHQPNIMDAGFLAMLYPGKTAGTYTLELSNQTFAGPKLIDKLNCK